jgi:hypothetical protein
MPRSTARPRAAKVVVIVMPPEVAKFHNKIAFVPRGLTYLTQDGDRVGPWFTDQWVFDDADGNVNHDTRLKTLLDDYVPDQFQTIELVLLIADAYRAATGRK